jgi:hypothetical protein
MVCFVQDPAIGNMAETPSQSAPKSTGGVRQRCIPPDLTFNALWTTSNLTYAGFQVTLPPLEARSSACRDVRLLCGLAAC